MPSGEPLTLGADPQTGIPDTSADPFWLSYIPHNFAADLLQHPDASPLGREQRFDAVALFADVSGFTAMSEALGETGRAGTEELTNVLNGYFAPMIELIQTYGGIIAKFGGDAMTVLFPFDDDSRAETAGRAVQCALEMQALMARYAAISTSAGTFNLTMKAGLAAGRVFCATVGDPRIRLEYLVGGGALDRCAEAERVAQPGEVVIHDDLLPALGDIYSQAAQAGFTRVHRLTQPVNPAPLAPLPPLSPESTHTLVSYLHPVIAERLRTGQASFVNEQRKVTVLFVGFKGFDYDGDPEVGRKLQAYFEQVVNIVHRYDGFLNKIDMGDKGSKYLVLFGAPVAHENDPERALRCALDLRALPAADIHVGVVSGFVFCGLVGSAARQEYTVMGDEVNLAARLMSASAADDRADEPAAQRRILVSVDAYAEADRTFAWKIGGKLSVKGKAEPVEVYWLTGLRQRASLGLHEPQYALPMVGRQAELDLVRAKLDLAAQGRGQIVGLTAEAGMGKSRLAAEVIRVALERGLAGFGGACLSHGTRTSYLVWHDVLFGLLGLDSTWPPEDQIRHVDAELAAADEQRAGHTPLRPKLPVLGVALSLAIPDNDLTSALDARLRKEALEALVVDFIRHRASAGPPLLLAFEDSHWLDPLSADLLEAAARNLSALPVLLLTMYRPAEQGQGRISALMAHDYATELRLAEFSVAETEQLVQLKLENLFGTRGRAPAALLEQIAARAQGNPFYVDELLNLMHDRGLDPQAPQAFQSLDLPDSLHSLIISRLDRLAEGPKTTVKVASVIGRVVKAHWLWGAHPELGTPDQVTAYLSDLERLDLVPVEKKEPELEYLFKHIVTRDVAYESLAVATRAMLHEKVADYVESNYGDGHGLEQLSSMLDLLAYHYSASRNTGKQREYLRRAGEAAQAAYANEAAVDYFERLLPLLKEAERADVLLKLGEVRQLMGEWSGADDCYRRALALAEKHRAVGAQAQSQRMLGALQKNRGQYVDALEWLERARLGFEAVADVKGMSQVLSEMGNVYFRQGDNDAARQHYVESLNLSRGLDDMAGIANALNNLGLVAHDQDDYAEARELYQECLRLYRELNDKRGIATSLGNLGQVANNQGDYAAARAQFEESLGLFRELGDKQRITALLNNLANAANNQGDYAAARALHEEGLALKREMGDKRGIAASLGNLGSVAVYQGDYAAARELYEESLAIKREIGDRRGISLTLNNLGLVAIYQGDHASAQAMYEESLAIKREIGDKRGIATSLNNLGLVAVNQGEYGQARALYEEGLATYREMGDKRGIANSLNDLGEVAYYEGHFDHAQTLFAESLALFQESGDKRGAALALYNTARLDHRRGQETEASARLHESLSLRYELGDKRGIAACLAVLTGVARAQAQWQRAAHLAAAAQSVLNATGGVFDAAVRAAYDENVAAVRSHLGEQAFAEAWAAGEGLTPEQAVDYALQ